MYFLHTIEEEDESAPDVSEEGRAGQESSVIRRSRHETDSEIYTSTMASSEKEPVSDDHTFSTVLQSAHDEPRSNSSSAPGSSDRRSSSTPQSSRSGSLLRRSSSEQRSTSSKASQEVRRRRSAGPVSEPALEETNALKKKTTGMGKKASSTTRRPRRRAQHGHLPAPQWVINLMFDIEEATMHELTVEEK